MFVTEKNVKKMIYNPSSKLPVHIYISFKPFLTYYTFRAGFLDLSIDTVLV